MPARVVAPTLLFELGFASCPVSSSVRSRRLLSRVRHAEASPSRSSFLRSFGARDHAPDAIHPEPPSAATLECRRRRSSFGCRRS